MQSSTSPLSRPFMGELIT